MTGNFQTGRTLCLLNENAQCNPIWVSQPDGLKLVHFQTLQPHQILPSELTGGEQARSGAAYESCERLCLPMRHLG